MQYNTIGQLNSNIQVKLMNKFLNRKLLDICYRSPIGEEDLELKMNMLKFYFSYAFTTPTIPTSLSFLCPNAPQRAFLIDLVEYNRFGCITQKPQCRTNCPMLTIYLWKIKKIVPELKHMLLENYFSAIEEAQMLKN